MKTYSLKTGQRKTAEGGTAVFCALSRLFLYKVAGTSAKYTVLLVKI